MLIKRKPDLTYKDVTPKALYMGRRNFCSGFWQRRGRWRPGRNSQDFWLGPATGSVSGASERRNQEPPQHDG